MQRTGCRYNKNSSVCGVTPLGPLADLAPWMYISQRSRPSVLIHCHLLMLRHIPPSSTRGTHCSTVPGPFPSHWSQTPSGFPARFRFSESSSKGTKTKGKRKEKFPCCSKKVFSTLGNAVLSEENCCPIEAAYPRAEVSTTRLLLFLRSCSWTLTVPA